MIHPANPLLLLCWSWVGLMDQKVLNSLVTKLPTIIQDISNFKHVYSRFRMMFQDTKCHLSVKISLPCYHRFCRLRSPPPRQPRPLLRILRPISNRWQVRPRPLTVDRRTLRRFHSAPRSIFRDNLSSNPETGQDTMSRDEMSVRTKANFPVEKFRSPDPELEERTFMEVNTFFIIKLGLQNTIKFHFISFIYYVIQLHCC